MVLICSGFNCNKNRAAVGSPIGIAKLRWFFVVFIRCASNFAHLGERRMADVCAAN